MFSLKGGIHGTLGSPSGSATGVVCVYNISNFHRPQDQDGRTAAVTSAVAREVEAHCRCGFTAEVISAPFFRCFPQSTSAVTLRARLTDSRFLAAVQDWIHSSGLIPIRGTLIQVDNTCQVAITSLTDTECTSQPASADNSVAVIGGVVGGVVIVLIIAITIVVVVIAILMFKSRRERLSVGKMAK